ncbi:hypothetical protein GT354_50690 [Streptomyces sp. SID3343]|nr:hypothetical protein [Streptomyces sp. SID3343]
MTHVVHPADDVPALAHAQAVEVADSHLKKALGVLFPGAVTELGETLPGRTHHVREARLHQDGAPPTQVLVAFDFGLPWPELLHGNARGLVAANARRAKAEACRTAAHRTVLADLVPTSRILAHRGPVMVLERVPHHHERSLAASLVRQPGNTGTLLHRLWSTLAPLRTSAAVHRLDAVAPLDERHSIPARFDRARSALNDSARPTDGWTRWRAGMSLHPRVEHIAVRIGLAGPPVGETALAHGGLDPRDIVLRSQGMILTHPQPHLAVPHSDLAMLLSRITHHLIGTRPGTTTADTVCTGVHEWISASTNPLNLNSGGEQSDSALRQVLRLWAMDTLTVVGDVLALPPDLPVFDQTRRGLGERATEVLDVTERIAHGLMQGEGSPRTQLADALALVAHAARA